MRSVAEMSIVYCRCTDDTDEGRSDGVDKCVIMDQTVQKKPGRATSLLLMQARSLVPLPLAMAGKEAGDSRLAAEPASRIQEPSLPCLSTC